MSSTVCDLRHLPEPLIQTRSRDTDSLSVTLLRELSEARAASVLQRGHACLVGQVHTALISPQFNQQGRGRGQHALSPRPRPETAHSTSRLLFRLEFRHMVTSSPEFYFVHILLCSQVSTENSMTKEGEGAYYARLTLPVTIED